MTANTSPRTRRLGRVPRARGPLLIALAACALFFAGAGDLSACPVCYGGAEGDVIEGAKLSVAFLGALVYSVMGIGVGMVVVARRRAGRDDPTAGPTEED